MIGLDKLNSLVSQEVSRKEFLQYMGIALMSLVGITTMLRNLSETAKVTPHVSKKSGGYGGSAYGQ